MRRFWVVDYGGPMLWPMEDAAKMMRWYREFIAKAFTTASILFSIRGGCSNVCITTQYCSVFACNALNCSAVACGALTSK